MTLIVARKIGNSVCIVSDTRITPIHQIGSYRHPFKGALKSIAINPFLCVSYAGNNREAAYEAIAEYCFVGEKSISPPDLADHLLRVHCRNRSTEFIVCKLDPPQIFSIRDGELNPNTQSAWIGDPAAYDVYQQFYLPWKPVYMRSTIVEPHRAKFLEELDRMTEAFKKVLERDSLCESVGPPMVCLYSTSSGFEYMTKVEGYEFGKICGTTIETNLMRMEIGKTYTYSMLVPENPGIGAIGIYINQIHKGGLFFPRESADAIHFEDCSVSDFIAKVKLQYGISLNGLMWSIG